ncbi:prolyl oligopeptidase family serine peptidase [Streptomyces triculaminicus]|uniref:prolyl oligopeptidase family serine peptidase n=1 Tax=Streptomyces triculaminicus TaxID=2816232 RepID=UPI0034048E27
MADDDPYAGREDDPYEWLEDVTGEDALAWVRERNAETAARLTGVPGFPGLTARLREVMDDTSRIPYAGRRGPHLYNFWQDADSVRGRWRRTTLEEYREERPAWEVLLDLDALAEAEGEPWVWDGCLLLRPDFRRALVKLSRDGADAVVVREFDLDTKAFVDDGFHVPEAKTQIGWIDRDHVFVGTDFGPGSMTTSGYPRTFRRWRRGVPLADAEPVFEVSERDLCAAAWHDPTEGFERDFVARYADFWHHEMFLLTDHGVPVKIDVPDDAGKDVHRAWLLVTPESPWLEYPAGSLLAFPFDSFMAGDRTATVLFTPDAHTSLVGYTWTRNHLIVETLTDVATRVRVCTPGPDGDWSHEPLTDVPPLTAVTITDTDPDTGDEYFLDVAGHLRPSTLYRGEIGRDREEVKRAPAWFDTAGMTVRQHFATSRDGTRVPYFVVGPDAPEGPTLLTGYGGFQTSLTPYYSGVTGRAWLAQGGTYVVANIRGGGEYGPRWHRSALKAGRERSFQDFAAVARDLVDRGITVPSKLGVTGGSNGGLLMGAMLTRYPHLFGAVVAQVPILDLLRFHRLLAGASWIAEYGDPDDPEDRAHLARLSPYHNLRADHRYPPVLLLTSTRDDRVHPAHARKTAARLRDMGHRVLFHESPGGGHSGASDHEQAAFNEALMYTFLWQELAAGSR